MSRGREAAIAKYGQPREISCELPSLDFPPVRERVHGEVCMAILRPNGRFLLQTKQTYPDSVMRLPSGGIREQEPLEAALLREIWEETNLSVRVDAYVACLRYQSGRARTPFATHLFLVAELDGPLRTNDPTEKITRWVEASPSELGDYATKLRGIIPSWNNWGLFRAAALDALARHCLARD